MAHSRETLLHSKYRGLLPPLLAKSPCAVSSPWRESKHLERSFCAYIAHALLSDSTSFLIGALTAGLHTRFEFRCTWTMQIGHFACTHGARYPVHGSDLECVDARCTVHATNFNLALRSVHRACTWHMWTVFFHSKTAFTTQKRVGLHAW